MIIADNITKSFNNGLNKVLNGVSLNIKDGEFAVILGASGSGKSTLLNILSGLDRPDGGRVLYGEKDITLLSDKQLTAFRRERIGFIFQQYYLLPHLSVANNVKLGANLAHNGDYVKIIEAVGLADRIDSRPSQLSGGEQQRVAIARALAKKPDVLFLDEPTGALDEKTGRDVLDFIMRVKKEEGFTMVMVTHNANIANMADTVIGMNSGKITQITDNPRPLSAYEIDW